MGQLWNMYEAHLKRHEPYPPSLRKVAGQVGISPTALGNWRHGLDGMPKRRNLLAFADLIGVSYSRVVDAALADSRYLPEEAARAAEEGAPLGKSMKDLKRITRQARKNVDESPKKRA